MCSAWTLVREDVHVIPVQRDDEHTCPGVVQPMDCNSAPSLPPKLRILPSGMSASSPSAALQPTEAWVHSREHRSGYTQKPDACGVSRLCGRFHRCAGAGVL
jgi:hypothetical protein